MEVDSNLPILCVFGATGSIGRWILWYISKGSFNYRVRVFVRDVNNAKELLKQLGISIPIEYYHGDVTDNAAIRSSLAGVNFIITAIEVPKSQRGQKGLSRAINEFGVKNIANAAREITTIKHLVLVSSISVTRPGNWSSLKVNEFGDNALIWKFRGENGVRRSGVPYTIIRSGGINNLEALPTNSEMFESVTKKKKDDNFLSLTISQGDQVLGDIGGSDLALLCLAALKFSEKSKSLTFEAISSKGDSWEMSEDMFTSLLPETQEIPDWELDEDVENCRICNSTLWLLNRKHHCRQCGRIVCGPCSDFEKPLPQYGIPIPVKICSNCDQLGKEEVDK